MTALSLENRIGLVQRRPVVLVVDPDSGARAALTAALRESCAIVEASGLGEAVRRVEEGPIDVVVIDVRAPVPPDPSDPPVARRIKESSPIGFLPVVLTAPAAEETALVRGLGQGADDFLTKPFNAPLVQAKVGALLRTAEVFRELKGNNDVLNARHERTEGDYDIARAIFRQIAQRSRHGLPGIEVRAQPLESFNGDIVFSAPLAGRRLRLLVGDFAGHGLSAAMGALPVADVFHAMTERGFAIEALVRELGGKLHRTLPRSLFLSACIVDVDLEGTRASVWNGGLPDVLAVGADGAIAGRASSRHPPLGVLPAHQLTAEITELALPPGARLVLYTDGLIEASSADGETFGQERLELALAAGNARPSCIAHLWEAFEAFSRDAEQRDDVTLVGVSNSAALATALAAQSPGADGGDELAVRLQLDPDALKGPDPLAPLRRVLETAPALGRHAGTLSTVASELFTNALEHGVLRLDSRMKEGPGGFSQYYARRKTALDNLSGGLISVSFQITRRANKRAAVVTVRDDGSGFREELLQAEEVVLSRSGRGLRLVRRLMDEVRFVDRGRLVEATLFL